MGAENMILFAFVGFSVAFVCCCDTVFLLPGASLRPVRYLSATSVPLWPKADPPPDDLPGETKDRVPGRADFRISPQSAPLWPETSASDAELPQESETNAKATQKHKKH